MPGINSLGSPHGPRARVMCFDSRSNCLYQPAPAAAPSRGAVAAAGFAMTGHFLPLAVAALPRVRVSTSNVSTFSSVFSLRYTLYAIPQIPRCGAGAGAQFAGVAQPPAHWPRGQRPAYGHVIFVTACHVSYAFIFSAHRLRRSTLSFMCGGVWCHRTPRSIGSLNCF